MVIGNPDAATAAANNVGGDGGANNNLAHPSGIPQDKIDNIMSGIANTGDVKMNNHRKKLRQRFDIIKKLGQGTYGKVQLGINKETGQEVAIKTIKKCKIEAEADLVRIRREVQIMSSVQHPNIIHIYEVFENREKMVLVMEFAAGGELYDYLSERKVLNEEEARRIFRQVATAVYYCHKHKICHRDLKLENILLDEHGNAKIADFGLSNVFDEQRLLATFCGSPLYASPEIVEGTPYQGPEVDCWSLGVLLYTLVYGSMPFDGSNFKRLVKQISQGEYYEPKKPSRASALIRDMLTVCPRKRATIEQICAHWWVNENDNVSCLDLAEDLANQTPVRLDVLLSLTPAAITADQLVVPSADGGAAGKAGERVPRSHSVGSIRDMGANTEAERRILDMVAAGGEAALMPSPTRTITPAQSPVQTKRKLEQTVSTENAPGAVVKKKEKPGGGSFVIRERISAPLAEETPMETEATSVDDESPPATPPTARGTALGSFSQKHMEAVGDLCELLIHDKDATPTPTSAPAPASAPPVTETAVVGAGVSRQRTVSKLDAVAETPEEKDATKVIKKFVNKHKTADLISAIGQASAPSPPSNKAATEPKATPAPIVPASAAPAAATTTASSKAATALATGAAVPTPPFVRKCSLQDEAPLNKFNSERRKSRILETAEKFQQMNANGSGADKPKKFSLPGVSVGSFKKEFERKASTTPAAPSGPTIGERRAMEQVAAAVAAAQELEGAATGSSTPPPPSNANAEGEQPATGDDGNLESSDSKNSVTSLSLEEARRSMENSIALLRQAQDESAANAVDQLCAQTESIGVSDVAAVTPPPFNERERKLKNARTIIGNAIQPVIRWPQAPPPTPPPTPQPQPPSPFFGIVGGGGGGYGHGAQMRGAHSAGSGNGYGGINGNANGINSAVVAACNGGGSGGARRFGGLTAAEIGAGYHNSNSYPMPTAASSYSDSSNRSANYQPQQHNHHHPQPTQRHHHQPQHHPHHQTPSAVLAATAANGFGSAELAAARQNIIGRLGALPPAGGWVGARQQQSSSPLHGARTTPNLSPYQKQQPSLQQQMQQHHYQLQQQQQQQSPPSHQQQQQKQQQQQHMYQHRHTMSTPIQPQHSAPYSAAASAATAAAAAACMIGAAIQNSVAKPFYNAPPPTSSAALWKSSPGGDPNAGNGTVKTSTASITLKSATLPRRKATAKTEIQLDIKPPRIVEQPAMRFSTEMQHPVADLRSAPPRDGPPPYSPIRTSLSARAASLEPKEHIIPIQRQQPPYARTTSNTTSNRSGSLSRQSTVDSESDTATTATNMSQSTLAGSSQPIKKSPREFIIPIAMEGGGFITPRERSIEPSESSHTAASSRSTFSNRLRPARRIGSLLSEAGVDESLPFQKMRTGSVNRDGDEDARFTLHKLRSSRPLKKISQDNDSQSSGEEDDDDDGFEILTAENLFSTLLQRVRALTNRLNVNNDMTAGFPNSTRLLSNMRQAQSPFWNQEPFGRSQVSFSFSQTVEKKHVRLHNSGAPWRHSMSRDLGTDMESMFSRTGATLPRGNKASKPTRTPAATILDPVGAATTAVRAEAVDGAVASDTATAAHSGSADANGDASQRASLEELPLDLADLDLSRLRLSKKDLETLSSITPGLPKCFQEQLLAKLPPTQARKLSRTLSMQNSPHVTTVKVYKRSQSGGRGLLADAPPTMPMPSGDALKPSECDVREELPPGSAVGVECGAEPPLSRSQFYRRSLSRPRYDHDEAVPATALKSRSSSVCRDDYGRSVCAPPCTSDAGEKHRYYSPYLSKSLRDSSSTENGSVSPQKRYGSGGATLPRESVAARPPSGCLSPPAISADAGSSSLRRLTAGAPRRTSRFLRPDFFDEPTGEPVSTLAAYKRTTSEQKQRERDTHSMLREIREKSRESSVDRCCEESTADALRRKYSLPGAEPEATAAAASKLQSHHMRNKSLEIYAAEPLAGALTAAQDAAKWHSRSLSRPRDLGDDLDKQQLADKILQELQLLSAVRSQQEQQRLSVPRESSAERILEQAAYKSIKAVAEALVDTSTTPTTDEFQEKTATIKRVKKIKPKEKSIDSTTTEGDVKITTTVVKKVKKIVKKSESVQTPSNEVAPTDLPLAAMDGSCSVEPKKESKLKRPKSYPTKELVPGANGAAKQEQTAQQPPITEGAALELINGGELLSGLGAASAAPRESRLVRPKSYPASKLTPPKDAKKATRSGATIPSITEGCTDESAAPASAGEARPVSGIKKTIKVTKKSKLVQPTALTPTSPTTSAGAKIGDTGDGDDDSKESSPTLKEKSPEKKPGKGLLYAIGQKFEKLRDSAMSKEKKSATTDGGSGGGGGTSKKSSPENNSSPEKIKEKGTLLKKKSLKTDKTAAKDGATSTAKPSASSADGNGDSAVAEKPAKSDKRSRIDAMIRSLRERSVPRCHTAASESNYLKRAVSVEEMPGTFNRNAVNKVLGLFRRFEKDRDGGERRVRSTRSTSNIERQLRDCSPTPTAAAIYENVARLAHKAAANCSGCEPQLPPPDNLSDSLSSGACPECRQDQATAASSVVTKRNRDDALLKSAAGDGYAANATEPQHSQGGNRDKRKGLMLDLDGGSKSASAKLATAAYMNGLYSNLPPYPGALNSSSNNSSSLQSAATTATTTDNNNSYHNGSNNINNNNTNINSSSNSNNLNNNSNNNHTSSQATSGYRTASAYEINRNHLLTPSTENMANYSSDSRSYQDDCASTSTFMSPTDEPELCFDNWSICSEDNYMLHASPSPTVSRLSRTSQLSPTRGFGGDSSDQNESVIDRIKRRSFYSRFNDKKPKRTSSIVGPAAVRDYYREQKSAAATAGAAAAAVNKTRSSHRLHSESERARSPDITHEFFRPLKLSPIGTELKPPIYRSPHEYSSSSSSASTARRTRKSLTDIRPLPPASTSPSFLSKRYGGGSERDRDDYLSLAATSSSSARYKSSSSSSPYEGHGAGAAAIGSGGGYYNTYNPKRRSSYTTLNGGGTGAATHSTATTSSAIDGYATLGRRSIRAYDQRTRSLLDPHTIAASSSGSTSTYLPRRETRTPVRDYTPSITRSNSRYRTSSVSRSSPTNI